MRESKSRSFDLQSAESHVQLRAVMCNTAEDVEYERYLNLFKNSIKIKRRLVFLAYLLVLLASRPRFFW